jgi:hypothetical protein
MKDNKRAADDAEREEALKKSGHHSIGINNRLAYRDGWNDCRAALSSRADVAADRTADRHYIAGMQVGYNFGVEENSAGMQKCIEQRQKDIRESKIDEPSRADGGKDSSDALEGAAQYFEDAGDPEGAAMIRKYAAIAGDKK